MDTTLELTTKHEQDDIDNDNGDLDEKLFEMGD